MAKSISLPFSGKIPTILHLDMNSCFATVEQQARPLLRGKPVAVAAYTTHSGCILAASIEAKRLGVKTGMRVREGRLLCRDLIILPPDPPKYRVVHQAIKNILLDYTSDVVPKSIDEFVLNLEGFPAFQLGLANVAAEMKHRIKAEVGDYLTVSVGIGPNRFLAKTAASLHKPDGLDTINQHNYSSVYSHLSLTDLCGINHRLASRLNIGGIHTVTDFYEAELPILRSVFRSISSYYWYLRLRGYEIDNVDFGRKSFGHSYALPKPYSQEKDLTPLIMKLTEKMSSRLRLSGYHARGIHLTILYRSGNFWHQSHRHSEALFLTIDLYKGLYRLFRHCPYREPVANLAVSCFDLVSSSTLQLNLFEDCVKKEKLATSLDTINQKFGDFTIFPSLMMNLDDQIVDRISFGR